MRYTVRVVHSSRSVEPKFEEFEEDVRGDEDAAKELHDEATAAYTAAVQRYDSGHTVSLFRQASDGDGAVAVHEALGTGSGKLGDEDRDDK